MTYRYQIEYLASGQPQPYADSIYHVRLTCEIWSTQYGNVPEGMDEEEFREPKWRPNETWKEEEIRALLLHLRCGFFTRTAAEREHGLESYLDWLKQTAPGVWEFRTVSPFTD